MAIIVVSSFLSEKARYTAIVMQTAAAADPAIIKNVSVKIMVTSVEI